jgi:hypothetical protein
MKASSRKSNPPSNVSKRQARRIAQQRSRLRSQIIQWVAIIVVVGGLAALIISYVSNQAATASITIEGLKTFPNQERGHSTEPITYTQNPPAGGVHHPAWQNCGVYTEPIPSEHAVHSLEHGAIWITYHPDLAAEEVQKLVEITRQSGYRLLSPYPDLPSPIVASAWGYQVDLDNADDPRLMNFISKYEQNPLGPEPGAACTGGVGTPS